MDIETRLRKLEWMNRVLITLLVVCAGYTTMIYLHSEEESRSVTADSIQTRSLSVVNTYGKQGFKIDTGDSGTVALTFSGTKGKITVGLVISPSGDPNFCLFYAGVCRIALGEVYRSNQRELSIQLNDKEGHPIWMPETPNPFIPMAALLMIVTAALRR